MFQTLQFYQPLGAAAVIFKRGREKKKAKNINLWTMLDTEQVNYLVQDLGDGMCWVASAESKWSEQRSGAVQRIRNQQGSSMNRKIRDVKKLAHMPLGLAGLQACNWQATHPGYSVLQFQSQGFRRSMSQLKMARRHSLLSGKKSVFCASDPCLIEQSPR